MELEGLKRCLAYLTEKEVNVTDLVTDRHSQVKKYMRESTNIRHWFDVWHVAKGMHDLDSDCLSYMYQVYMILCHHIMPE